MDDFNEMELELTSEGKDYIKEEYTALFDEINTGSEGILETFDIKDDKMKISEMAQLAVVRALQDIAAELRGLRADIRCLGADNDE